MITTSGSWPVRIRPHGSLEVAVGTVLWQVDGIHETRVTAIVKATFTLVAEALMTLREPDPLVLIDVHHHNDSDCSLRAASDLAPYLDQAEVLLTGHAYAPPGKPTPTAGARLVIHREGQTLLNKTVSIHGDRKLDRAGQLSAPTPFQRMPLLYERTIFHVDDNPVGVDSKKGRLPNIVDTVQGSRPAGFGPLARQWPIRRRLLGDMDPRQIEGTRLQFPEKFDWMFFHASPPDQRIEFFYGHEGILLGGMHPTLPMMRTRMPGVTAHARVCLLDAAPDQPGERLPLWADTLTIDTDRQVASLLWRGNFAVADEQQLRGIRILAGLDLPESPLVFPGEEHQQIEDEETTTIQFDAAAIELDDEDEVRY